LECQIGSNLLKHNILGHLNKSTRTLFDKKTMILDLSQDNSLLREAARTSLENTTSPMFMIKNFGFEDLLKSVVQRVSIEQSDFNSYLHTQTNAGRSHFDLQTEETQDDPLYDEFRTEMKSLATRIATILFGTAMTESINLDGPLSIKSYSGTVNTSTSTGTYAPNQKEPEITPNNQPNPTTTCTTRLGAHVDGNMFTLLWSNTSGLQVLNPDKEVSAEDLMYYGCPLVGVGPSLIVKDEDFVDVVADWSSENVMLVTIGRSWFSPSNPLTKDSDLNVKCPVLHRVAFQDQEKTRYSIPFLVNVQDV